MADFEHVSTVKRTVQSGLLALSGVHAVGVGLKRINDQPTDELSIIVFCVRKLPLSELAASNVVPAEIDGVKTDVIEMAVPRPHVEHDTSRPRPMLGGVAMQAKGANEFGTLGCFAMTQEAQPKVVAITCQHVVAPPTGSQTTDVHAVTPAGSPNPYKITFGISGPTAAGSLVVVKMGTADFKTSFTAYWTVTGTDTPATIASGVITAINTISGSGATAAIGPHVEDVLITIAANSTTLVREVSVYDPPAPDKEVKLQVAIAGNVITVTGKVDGEYCAYVSWNTNGSDPTRGVFIPLPEGTAVTAVPGLIVQAIMALGVSGITPSSTQATVTVGGAAQVACLITRDIRAGQPTDGFSSNCSLCCSDEMGRVIAARLHLDTALVQVRRKIQYLNEIKGDEKIPIGNTIVKGARDLTGVDAVVSSPVVKRGATTGYTTGTVAALDVHGYTFDSGSTGNLTWTVFSRYYDNAIQILGDGGAPFSDGGDSGSAVLDTSGKVVGILFGGSTRSVVTPIGLITSELKIAVPTATALNQVQTVTDVQGALAAVLPTDNQMIKQVLTTQAEVAATPAGKRYTELIGRHSEEVQDLVNTNLRVAVVWHRNSGPEILRAAFRYIQYRDERLPQEIEGVPLTERLIKIRDALMRYGSAELSEDLARYGAELLALTSLSYADAIERMRASEPAGADAS